MESIQTGILTADPSMRRFLNETIYAYGRRRQVDIQCRNADSLHALQEPGPRCDLLFLDDGVESRSPLENARVLRSRKIETPLVLLSRSPDGVFDSFEVDTYRYLVKPISQTAIFESLDGIRKRMVADRVILARVGTSYHAFRSDEIFLVEASGKDCLIHTGGGSYHVANSYAETTGQLPAEYFFTVHRSYTVNMERVRSFDTGSITLDNDLKCPLSRRRKTDFYRTYSRFVRQHTAP